MDGCGQMYAAGVTVWKVGRFGYGEDGCPLDGLFRWKFVEWLVDFGEGNFRV